MMYISGYDITSVFRYYVSVTKHLQLYSSLNLPVLILYDIIISNFGRFLRVFFSDIY